MMKFHFDLYRPGVGAIILNPEGKVLVGKRCGQSGEAWQLPQGGIDPNEDLQVALFRELMEEIGTNNLEILHESQDWYQYDVPEDIATRLWQGRYKGQRQKWYLLRFLGVDQEIVVATEHPEFEEWKWIDFLALEPYIIHFKKQLYHELIRDFHPLIKLYHPDIY
jgi:putative (di)nucleoside polyphosphate hydrolase